MKFVNSFVCISFLIESISATRKTRQIVGGETADIENYPYQVSIRYEGKHGCGGAIISDTHILTAAHCMAYFTPPYTSLLVHSGTNSLNENGQTHRVLNVKYHPQYIGTDSLLMNDIAIVTIFGDIKFNAKQLKIKLPSKNVVTGSKGNVTGWGPISTATPTTLSTLLQRLEVKTLPNKECDTRLHLGENLLSSQLCAVHSEGHGCILGDSGGPLVIKNEIAGILSSAIDECYASGFPDIYTNVFEHKGFIETAMRKG